MVRWALALLLALPAAWGKETPLPLDLVEVATGLASPLAGAHAGDGSGRLFIVEQPGRVRILAGHVLRATPFLDITQKLVPLNPIYDERGLLGLAFHPGYPTNGRFFVFYSAPGGSLNHRSVLAEYHVSAGDPNRADAAGERVVLSLDQPGYVHHGGCLAFGPDGYLYVSTGDGLDSADESQGPGGPAQKLDNLYGKILRLDVDGRTPYDIAPDNPFALGAGRDEIWAYGFRNPWRFSFDRGGAHRLLAGDVGDHTWEEVSIIVRGGNYGWRVMEGNHCHSPTEECDTTGKLLPILEYDHGVGIAVVGGYVYRGAAWPRLVGTYVFGDYTRPTPRGGRLFFATEQSDHTWTRGEFLRVDGNSSFIPGMYLLGMAEGEDGELYALGSTSWGPFAPAGGVYGLAPGGPAAVEGDLNGDGRVDYLDLFLFLIYWRAAR